MGLTGLERKLVLDYLKDGDASLTVACEKLTFPIALKRAQYDLLEQGILILKTLEENPQKYDSLEKRRDEIAGRMDYLEGLLDFHNLRVSP